MIQGFMTSGGTQCESNSFVVDGMREMMGPTLFLLIELYFLYGDIGNMLFLDMSIINETSGLILIIYIH